MNCDVFGFNTMYSDGLDVKCVGNDDWSLEGRGEYENI